MPAYAYTGLTAAGKTVKGIETSENDFTFLVYRIAFGVGTHIHCRRVVLLGVRGN